MKKNIVTEGNPFAMAGWVPLRDRVELSLIFMTAASAGEAVLASRGLAPLGYVAISLTSVLMFSVLWILPILNLKSVLRVLVLGVVWSGSFTVIEVQIRGVMTPQVSWHEVYSR
jgi:predicted membrane metal-binding protein